ncbi:MAG: four helix bundle protein [Cyclobacteriaceae bacterium]|jgi:four helix bundle protein|nr:four helix bundle protein [Cyclobacteriaceae bacterium]
MAATQKFEELIVWQRAHQFVLLVYRNTAGFPKDELYGLTSQFRRAAISIAANIAEGYVKRTKPEKIRFLNISQGSVEECRYYIILSRDLKYTTDDALGSLLEEVSKLLNSYTRAIKISNI